MSNSVHNSASQSHNIPKKKPALKTHLLQPSTLGADESHTVAIIDVGGHRGHAITAFRIKRVSGHQLRAAKGLVDVQTAEGVINRDRLQEEKGQPSQQFALNQKVKVRLVVYTDISRRVKRLHSF